MPNPTEGWWSNDYYEALVGATRARTGLVHPSDSSAVDTPNLKVILNRFFDQIDGRLAAVCNGLVVYVNATTVGVFPMIYRLGGNNRSFAGDDEVSIPADGTYYLYLDDADALQLGYSWPADKTTFVPLATVKRASGAIGADGIVDKRPLVMFAAREVWAEESHTHVEADVTDLDKYTQDETDTLLVGKSDTSHTHPTLTVEPHTEGSTSPHLLDAADSGKVLTNQGCTAKGYHTLPAAAAGLHFTFICQDADGIRATAVGDDTIRVAGTVSPAAGYVESTTVGSALHLVGINAGEWIAVDVVGTWVVQTP